MEQHRKDLIFPFVVSGMNVNQINRYHQVLNRLQAVENKWRQVNPAIDLSRMWSVRCTRGKMIFYVTAICKDRILKSELLSIFTNSDDSLQDITRYTWKKAPKLSASSILSVI